MTTKIKACRHMDAETEICNFCGHWRDSPVDDPYCNHPEVQKRVNDYKYCDNRWCPIRPHTRK